MKSERRGDSKLTVKGSGCSLNVRCIFRFSLRAVMEPVLKHMDLHAQWKPPPIFAIHVFKAIIYSIQSQNSYFVIQVMTVEDLAREMNEIIDEVSAILRIGRGHCRILLHKFNWNKESLLERYYENPDTDAFLRKAQVLPRKPAPPPLSSIMNDATSEIQCIFNGCQLLIQDEKVMQYIQSEAVRNAYQRLKINSFVEGNRLLKWCPGLDCGKAFIWSL
ncbi:hypothetical protein OSTOST_10692 [Ostertagia ostertagi]